MAKNLFYNIIDFGSSKLRFSIFDNNLNNKFYISKSVKLENNFEAHFNEINNLIKHSEKKIKSHIKDLILIIDSKEMFYIDLSLNKNFTKKIKFEKAFKIFILEIKQIISSNYENLEIIHIINSKCIIDKKTFFGLPKNETNFNNLKIDFKIICLPKKLTNLLRYNLNKINLNLSNIFCSSYVKSLAYLNKLNLDKVSFLDIGYERTNLLSYINNNLIFFKTLPIGSDHITRDISKVLNIDPREAEKLKKIFNKSETEFSYLDDTKANNLIVKDILKKNISIELLKKVILYRVQEIIDLAFKNKELKISSRNLKNTELFLIGEGALLFNNNAFHLNDKVEFKSINFFSETGSQICNSGLTYYLNSYEIPKITRKKAGLFEKFFNFFSR